MNNDGNYETISPYDRLRGNLKDVATTTKPTTIQEIESITGRAVTYIVVTYRTDQGDYVFLEYVDQNREVIRVPIPPRVANAIASQRASLTTRRRSAAAKQRASNLTEEQKQALRDRLAKVRKKARKSKAA